MKKAKMGTDKAFVKEVIQVTAMDQYWSWLNQHIVLTCWWWLWWYDMIIYLWLMMIMIKTLELAEHLCGAAAWRLEWGFIIFHNFSFWPISTFSSMFSQFRSVQNYFWWFCSCICQLSTLLAFEFVSQNKDQHSNLLDQFSIELYIIL